MTSNQESPAIHRRRSCGHRVTLPATHRRGFALVGAPETVWSSPCRQPSPPYLPRTCTKPWYPFRTPNVPRQAFLQTWRQLVLPVHLQFLTPLLSCIVTVSGYVELQDDRVVDHPVDGRSGGHGGGEDPLPPREEQVWR